MNSPRTFWNRDISVLLKKLHSRGPSAVWLTTRCPKFNAPWGRQQMPWSILQVTGVAIFPGRRRHRRHKCRHQEKSWPWKPASLRPARIYCSAPGYRLRGKRCLKFEISDLKRSKIPLDKKLLSWDLNNHTLIISVRVLFFHKK